MTKAGKTAILAIIDRSGSMASIRKDMEGGFQTFLEDQAKVEGECLITLVQFDDEYERVYANVLVGAAPKFSLVPRGSTALLDAMGRAITEFGEVLAEMPEDERPEKIIVPIITDGYENASREWTKERVSELVKQQSEQYSWQFLYLGANQDAIAVGTSLGMNAGSTITYDSMHVDQTFAAASAATTRSRMGSFEGYTEEERSAVVSGK